METMIRLDSNNSYAKQFDLIDRAIEFAALAHAKQVRKGTNLPYIVHPMESMMICATMTDDVEIIAAAALHDVYEDTEYTYQDILERFGERIANLVASESEDKRKDRPASDTWRIRKQETIDRAFLESTDSKMILLSDKLSNIRSSCRDYDEIGDDIWLKFNQTDPKQHEWYYRSLAKALEELKEYDAYREYLDRIEYLFAK